MKFVIGLGFLFALTSCQTKVTTEGHCRFNSECSEGLVCASDSDDPNLVFQCVCPDDQTRLAETLAECADGDASVGGNGGTSETGSGGTGTGGTAQGGTGGTIPPPECSISKPCGTATKPVCSAEGLCGACSGDTQCQTLSASKPVCGTTGACVECKAHADCEDATKPVCGSDGTCGKCTGSPQCVAGGRAGKLCQQSTGSCVSCLVDNDCSGTTPICKDNACVACGAATANACMTKNAALSACAGTGACVECTSAAAQACTGGKPVCHTDNTCRRCGNDTECNGKGPAVCMDHDDGRCATDAETVTVQGENLQSAVDQVTAGTKKVVVFSGGVGAAQFAGPGTLVMVGKGVAQVRQTSAALDAPPALRLTGGTTYARGFLITQSPGGVLINGAAFDFRNLDVSRNSVGTFGGALKWGGILVMNPGTPAKMRNVSITFNTDNGMVCSTAIDIDATVTASSNAGGDIAPECVP
jgi:hypothetical protein